MLAGTKPLPFFGLVIKDDELVLNPLSSSRRLNPRGRFAGHLLPPSVAAEADERPDSKFEIQFMNPNAPFISWLKSFNRVLLTTTLLTGTEFFTAEVLSTPADIINSKASSIDDQSPTPPPAALGANYTTLKFHDEFNSIDTIDINNTHAPGYNWYVQLPFGWKSACRDAYDVTNGVLKIGSGDNAGWVLSTWSGSNGNGHAFCYGYFEARVHFDPTKGSTARSWPAFWSFPVEHAWGPAQQHWVELDFFEAYTGGFSKYDGGFYGTVHDWAKDGQGKPVNHQNHNNYTPLNVDWNQWHVVGCLWMPGKISWYLDDALLKSINYSSGHAGSVTNDTPSAKGLFSVIDKQNDLLVLGSSTGWEMYVDYVRVWQK